MLTAVFEVFEYRWLSLQDLLPFIIGLFALLKLFEFGFDTIKLPDNFINIVEVVTIKEFRVLSRIKVLIDLAVELWHELSDRLLVPLSFLFTLTLDFLADCLELRDGLKGLFERVIVLFFNLKLEFIKNSIDLSKHVDTVPYVLEVIITIVVKSILLNELLHACVWLAEVPNLLFEPFLGLVVPCLDDFWDEDLDLGDIRLRSGLNLLS